VPTKEALPATKNACRRYTPPSCGERDIFPKGGPPKEKPPEKNVAAVPRGTSPRPPWGAPIEGIHHPPRSTPGKRKPPLKKKKNFRGKI